jgi:hypothetical protein
MSESTFPHHSGGVVHVQYVTRYGSVPEALLEDSRLDLDSRAVAAWLAVKPAGWQISVTNLRLRLPPQGSKMLGKDRWQRIALELESAGYLVRRKVNGEAGQWIWHITFNPVPASLTVAVLAGCGSAAHGSPTDGRAVDGQPGRKVIPSTEVPTKKPTTTRTRTRARPKEQRCDGVSGRKSVEKLHYPKVTNVELAALEKLILLCHVDARQEVLDEIEGIRQEGRITRGVVPLAKALIAKVANGAFTLSAGHDVLAQREKRHRHELAISVSAAPVQALLPMSEADIEKLPPNVARRIREQMTKRGRP